MKQVEIEKLFKKEGLRLTGQRRLVYTILRNSHLPLTAEEIYREYIKNDQAISLSTIYRILEVFVAKDLVDKGNLSFDQKASYVIKQGHIHYLICTNCKKVIEIDDCPFHDFESSIEKETAFKITGHKLELSGLCPDCK